MSACCLQASSTTCTSRSSASSWLAAKKKPSSLSSTTLSTSLAGAASLPSAAASVALQPSASAGLRRRWGSAALCLPSTSRSTSACSAFSARLGGAACRASKRALRGEVPPSALEGARTLQPVLLLCRCLLELLGASSPLRRLLPNRLLALPLELSAKLSWASLRGRGVRRTGLLARAVASSCSLSGPPCGRRAARCGVAPLASAFLQLLLGPLLLRGLLPQALLSGTCRRGRPSTSL